MNTIAYADEWAAEAREAGKDYNEVRREIQDRALEEHPILLGIVTHVNYDAKSDRYIIKNGTGSTVRVSIAVAEFLLTQNELGGMKPTVYARMKAGTIDSVLLLYLTRG